VARGPNRAPRLVTRLDEVSAERDVILCDVWGVVHDGRRAFAPACAALTTFREQGGVVILLTNAPRPSDAVAAQLASLGVPDDAFDAIVSSGDVTLECVAALGPVPLCHIGPARDRVLFDTLARRTGRAPVLVPPDEAGHVVCTGLYDDETETPADYHERLAAMAQRGLVMICGNPDRVVHVHTREIWCAGALADVYSQMGGTVIQAGKPYGPIYQRALEVAARLLGRPADPARILAIGDGLHTDVAGARIAGLDALFITMGIHREALHPVDASGQPAPLDSARLAHLLEAEGALPPWPLAAMPVLA
jgi:HAD superfamily hydrolase (TIGR01459 family)